MKFKKQALVDAVQAEIAQREESAQIRRAEVTEQYEEAKAEWWASSHPEVLKQAAQHVLALLRRKQPVTGEDVAPFTHRYSEAHTFQPAPNLDANIYQPKTDGLRRLLTILESTPDEEISTTALKDLGYKDLTYLFRAAAD